LETSVAAGPLSKPKSAEARKYLRLGNKLTELEKYDLAISNRSRPGLSTWPADGNQWA